MEVGQVNKGADISWLSQYPNPCEACSLLFPTLNFFGHKAEEIQNRIS